ncbi:MAG: hypothetical protein Q8O67_25565 [Deltaproteobacteria bacterium]|nr:hypothetical protein [Deltaproteobacteria bacterium]
MNRSRCFLAVAAVLTAAGPASAHGDMAGMAIAELFALVVGAFFLLVFVVLAGLAWRMTAKGPASAGAVFRAGLVGIVAVVAFTVGGACAAMGSEAFFKHTPAAFQSLVVVVPALFAGQLLLSARLYRRVEARALAVGSTVFAVVFLLVGAFFAFALIVDAQPHPDRTSAEVRGYEEGCERDVGSDCNMLGLRLRAGSGIKADRAAAARAFAKACKLKTQVACVTLAEMMRTK